MEPTNRLKRSLSAPVLAFYGLGTMLGAGVFALIGEVVADAGRFAPLSFFLAALVAAMTSLSFAELSARFPRAAGEAAYTAAAFRSKWLPVLIGLLTAGSGIVSAGVMVRSFLGYADIFLQLPVGIGIVALTLILTALAGLGVVFSTFVVVLITALEVGVLVLIIVLGSPSLPTPAPTTMDFPGSFGVLTGSVLAFYAFIGFEDMVNMAEEVRHPRRSMPVAIITALISAATLYVLVSWTAVKVTPLAELASSTAPMALVFSNISDLPPSFVRLVAMIAVINGALVQIVMASRVLYGLADQGRLPRWLGVIDRRTKTPLRATASVGLLIILAASLLPLADLAKTTSLLLLSVFMIVNISLIRIKARKTQDKDIFSAPTITPYLGLVLTAGLALISVGGLVF